MRYQLVEHLTTGTAVNNRMISNHNFVMEDFTDWTETDLLEDIISSSQQSLDHPLPCLSRPGFDSLKSLTEPPNLNINFREGIVPTCQNPNHGITNQRDAQVSARELGSYS
jgi:hypothetical protein